MIGKEGDSYGHGDTRVKPLENFTRWWSCFFLIIQVFQRKMYSSHFILYVQIQPNSDLSEESTLNQEINDAYETGDRCFYPLFAKEPTEQREIKPLSGARSGFWIWIQILLIPDLHMDLMSMLLLTSISSFCQVTLQNLPGPLSRA